MCLSKVRKVYNPPLQKEFTAYKVFDLTALNDSGIKPLFNIFKFKFNQWQQAIDCKGDNGYPIGFHCYATKKVLSHKNLSGRVVLKVKIRGILARGLQDNCSVIVAKEMFIPVPSLKE